MQKLQQQLSDTSGLERGGGLAGVLASYWGEWTTFNGNLQDGEFVGRQLWLRLVVLIRARTRRTSTLGVHNEDIIGFERHAS